jgi:hypothetical protein
MKSQSASDHPSMRERLLETWLLQPPETLVVGDGPYPRALAQILGIQPVSRAGLASWEQDCIPSTKWLVLGRLRLAFLIASSGDSLGDLVALHRGLWDWVVRLSPDQEEHRLRVIFILPGSFERFAGSLASGLAFPSVEASRKACSIVAMGLPLPKLLAVAETTPMTDFVAVRGRFLADQRRNTLRRLASRVSCGEAGSDVVEAIRDAAVAVMEAFRNQEYDLDLFCHYPRHRNGNILRQWLGHAVTGLVTPLDWKALVIELD